MSSYVYLLYLVFCLPCRLLLDHEPDELGKVDSATLVLVGVVNHLLEIFFVGTVTFCAGFNVWLGSILKSRHHALILFRTPCSICPWYTFSFFVKRT
jgi:hypothetical protein